MNVCEQANCDDDGTACALRHCLAIMVKAPIAGQVKTRLAEGVGTEQAVALYRAFVTDTVARAQHVPGVEVVLAYWPPEAHAYFAAQYPALRLLLQEGANLGERLGSVFTAAAADGYAGCVIIGSDSPTVPVAYLEAAVAELATVPVVLGPAEDGGYYLLGLREPQPALLADIVWSTDQVCRETLERARGVGLAVSQLPPWYDIDTVADLTRLIDDLAAQPSGRASASWHALTQADVIGTRS